MKIENVKIDKFAPFTNVELSNLSAKPIVMFHGNNESGKTSLFDFIRFVLFARGKLSDHDKKYLRKDAQGALDITVAKTQETIRLVRDKNNLTDEFKQVPLTNVAFRNRFILKLDDLGGKDAKEIELMIQDTTAGIFDPKKYGELMGMIATQKNLLAGKNEATVNSKFYLNKEDFTYKKLREKIDTAEETAGSGAYAQLVDKIAKAEEHRDTVGNALSDIRRDITRIKNIIASAQTVLSYKRCARVLHGTPLQEPDTPSAQQFISAFKTVEETQSNRTHKLAEKQRAQTALDDLKPIEQPSQQQLFLTENATKVSELYDDSVSLKHSQDACETQTNELNDARAQVAAVRTNLGCQYTDEHLQHVPPSTPELNNRITEHAALLSETLTDWKTAQGAQRGAQLAGAATIPERQAALERAQAAAQTAQNTFVVCASAAALFLCAAAIAAVITSSIPWVALVLCAVSAAWSAAAIRTKHHSATALITAKEQLETAKNQAAITGEEVAGAEQKHREQTQRWHDFCIRECRLVSPQTPPEFTPEFVREQLTLITTLRTLTGKIEKCETHISKFKEQLGQWENALGQWCAQLEIDTPKTTGEKMSTLKHLATHQLPAAQEQTKAYRQYLADAKHLQDILRQREKDYNENEQAHHEAMAQVGNNLSIEEAQNLKQAYEEFKLLDRDETLQDTAKALEQLGDDHGEEKLRELELQKAQLKKSHEEIVGQLALDSSEKTKMEKSSDIANLVTQRNTAAAQAQEYYRQFAVLCAAEELLKDAKAQVTEADEWFTIANEIFSTVTGGEWTKFAFDTKDALLYYNADGKTTTANTPPSRGTAEQAYLAARLAFAVCYGKHHEPMPIILDDVMVNFDEGRTANALRAIGKIATDHPDQQIIIFSCHQWFAQTAKQILTNQLQTITITNNNKFAIPTPDKPEKNFLTQF